MSQVRLFGIRHHGPGSARSLRRALDEFEPDVILIEGPVDADAMIPHVPNLSPPIALLAWVGDEPSRAAFWPFATFSPEWQALDWAAAHTCPVTFIDLPSTLSLARDREESAREDPLRLLAEAAGYDDPERWWEDLVEQRDADVFDVIAEAMTAVREELDDDDETLVREAHMRKALRAAKRNHEKVAVVCGAYHVPALAAKVTVAQDNARLKGLPKAKTQLTWVPWSHGRLAAATGYGAGVRSPGWYHHLFAAPDRPVERWLTHVGGVLRAHDLPMSSAHVIEAVRLADTLAVLRGRPMPGLSEVQEATLAVLCEGSDLALDLVTREAMVGELLGAVPDSVPRTPFDADLTATARRLRLRQDATPKDLDLDLRKDNDLARSRLLRRLRILGIGWGTFTGQAGTGTFRESWRIVWEPEFAVAVIDASRWGNTVEHAAGAKLLDDTADLAGVTRGVEQALLAELPGALPELLRLLDLRAAAETDVARLLEALPELARAHRYGDVRGTDTGRLGEVVEALLARATAGLPAALSGLAPEEAERFRGLIDAAHAAVGLLGDDSQALWRAALLSAIDRADLPGVLAGRLVRLLYDAGVLSVDEVRERLSLALSGGYPPAEQAAWADGVLAGSSLLLLHSPALLRLLDQWLLGLPEEQFTEVLPVLRRAVGRWEKPERRALAGKVANLDHAQEAPDEELDLTGLAEVLATVETILEVKR
ncbi:MAG: DUF5682 family protein [Propionibacteriaceae bacterium]|nr:DUF5682 family protein [Propionibacteriaceae bacterium]